MKLIMTLLVKDEEDILRENIEYHKSQGVDIFIAMDNMSTDKTPKVLKYYENEGVLYYIQESEAYNQRKFVTRMARLAFEKFAADWVINNDADEFWWSNTGNLKAELANVPDKYGAVRATRHNMLLRHGSMNEPFYKGMIYRKKVSTNPVDKRLPPKVCHRGIADIIVGAGSHNIVVPKDLKILDSDIEIFHYPVRSYNQLIRKVTNIGKGYERHYSARGGRGNKVGNAQREIYSQFNENQESLKLHYQKYVVGSLKDLAAIFTGKIIKDIRLSDYLDKLLKL